MCNMKSVRYLSVVFVMWLYGLSLSAQVLTITNEFELVANSSVLAMYKNHFGSWEKPDLDDSFPYAVVRVALEGDEREVSVAKKKLGLYLGTQRMVVDIYTDGVNEILFLIPSAAGHVKLQCGDGCETVTIIDLPRLRSNMVYSGKVHYVPAENTDPTEAVDKEQLKTELLTEIAQMLQEQNKASQDGEKNVTPKEEPKEDSPTMLPKVDLSKEMVRNPNQPTVIAQHLSKPKETSKKGEVTPAENTSKVLVENSKMKTLLMGAVGYFSEDQVSYGVKIGQMYPGVGWYVSARSNFQFEIKEPLLLCDEQGLVNGMTPTYTENVYATHWVANAGLLVNFLAKRQNKSSALGLYLGAGYGKSQLLKETINGEWVESASTSFKGFSGDVGLFGNLHGLTVSIGVNTISFKYVDVEIGVGYMF